jgi:hypothetical protein
MYSRCLRYKLIYANECMVFRHMYIHNMNSVQEPKALYGLKNLTAQKRVVTICYTLNALGIVFKKCIYVFRMVVTVKSD